MAALPNRRLDEARRQRANEKRADYTTGATNSTPPPTQAPIQLSAQNVELEARLLAALLYDSQLLPVVRQAFTFPEGSRVRPFFREAHQELYERMCALYDKGDIPEYYTILDEWVTRENAGLDARDERELIDRLMIQAAGELVPSDQRILQWASKLKAHAIRRAATDIATTAAGIAYPSDIQAASGDPFEDMRKLSEQITRLASSTIPLASRFNIISDEEAQAMQPAKGILGDILYEDSVAFMYGPSGRWKSFIAVAWAMCLATGRDWMGRQVEEGDVLYIAGEGARGVGKRITAWKNRHGVTGKTRMHVLGTPVHLLDAAQIQELIGVIRAQYPGIKLVIIDTLARALIGGDENSTADANMAFEQASQIRAALGCCVLVIHHSGKDGARGMRGSSVFFNNADTVIRIAGFEDKPLITPGETVKLVSEKPKENDPFSDIHITAEIERWANEHGDITSSLVIVASSVPDTGKQASGAKPFVPMAQRKMIDALAEHPEGLRFSEWETVTGIPHNTFSTNRKMLAEREFIACDGTYYTLTESGRSLSTVSYQTGTTVPNGTDSPV